MAGKNFRNTTDELVWAGLTVRQGPEPWAGTPYSVDLHPLPARADTFVDYGNDENPFVDAVEVTHDANFKEGVTRVDAEHARGGPNDSAMNTNDTVTVSVGGDGKLALAFSNG